MVTAVVVEGPGPSLDGPGLERAGRPAAQALRGGLDANATADRVLDAASEATTMRRCWSWDAPKREVAHPVGESLA
ncbi:hypothetical protein AB5J72_00570 [Streptomyces sp. CG1]|uniref:hypothetical protein n=1 Tax=Streptomyces sp. CG1 TaxID=1287523 RepID=UPI0034E2D38C